MDLRETKYDLVIWTELDQDRV